VLAGDITKFTVKFWKDLSGNFNRGLIGLIIDRFTNGKNYKGEQFASYAKGYAKAKASGEVRNLEGRRQESYSSDPDMTLTGEMRKGLKRYGVSDEGFTIGWIGVNAEKVNHLHGHKNYQIVGLDGSQVLSDDEEEFVSNEMEAFIGRKIKDYEKDDIIIKL